MEMEEAMMEKFCRFRLSVSWFIVLSALHLITAPAFGDQSSTFDCGTLSLYVMLRLENKSSNLVQISSSLPEVPASGLSMRDLLQGANNLGLHLKGIRLPEGGFLDYSPALIYLDRGDHGHYVVIRAVVQSGKFIQVFDLLHDPVIREMAEFRSSREWTGLALVPIRESRISWVLTRAIVPCSFIFIVLMALTCLLKLLKLRKPAISD